METLTLVVDGEELPLSYAYRPGREDDGVTVKMPYKLIHFIPPDVLEWLVPGLLQEKITHLLRGLPKAIRKRFVPVPETAREIALRLRSTHGAFLATLEAFILDRYGVEIQRSDWPGEALPDHLHMRIEVQGTEDQPIATGRNLENLLDHLEQHDTPAESAAWKQAAKTWEQNDLKAWTCGDIPERVEVTRMGGVPIYGYPGLKREGETVCLRLFKRPDEAECESCGGLIRLYEGELKAELRGLKRELQDLNQLEEIYWFEGGGQALQEVAYAHLVEYLFARKDLHPLTGERFEAGAQEAREQLRGLVPHFIDLIQAVLKT